MSDIDWNAIALVFIAFVVPMWMFLHYGSRWRASRGLAAQDEKLLTDLWDAARRMEERLDNLERALGSDTQRKS
ncbi:MAG TPA: envelope stress response membrane protein PspB [Alphaproteobacteria bacterium]|jgi:phage shock protein B|nr:envelope stress response membrane protein PspB [Alphaproteobacteria bacterium]